MGNPASFTVRTGSRRPDLDEDYDAEAHRYRDRYVDPDRVSYALSLDAFPGSEVIDTIVVSGPKGKPKEIEIERLNLPDDAVAYDWHIDQRDGGFERSASTPIRHHTVGGVSGVFGTPYRKTFRVPEPGVYDIDLQVRLESGGGPTHSTTYELSDYLVVSLGDSYASGEGNPDRAGKPAGFDLDTEWWEVVLVPVLLFKVTTAALRWARDTLKREFTTLSQAADAEIDMDPEPIWLEEQAHRSLRAGPALATGLIEDVRGGDVVTFVSFARSGAEIQDGLFGPRTEDGDPIDGWIGNDGQIGELRDLSNRIGDRSIDALLLSIGGNDAGFSGRLSDMVSGDNPFLSLSLGDDDEARENARQQVDEALERLAGTDDEPGEFDRLAAALEGFDVEHVYITEYPTGHFERTENGQVTVEGGCGIFSSFFDADIDEADARLMRASARRLNDVIRSKAAEHGWVYVGDIADGFSGRGYCAGEDSFFVSAEESLVTLGDTRGTLHPSARGQQVQAESIAPRLRRHMIEGEPVVDASPDGMRAAVGRHDAVGGDPISVRSLADRFDPSPPDSVRALLRAM